MRILYYPFLGMLFVSAFVSFVTLDFSCMVGNEQSDAGLRMLVATAFVGVLFVNVLILSIKNIEPKEGPVAGRVNGTRRPPPRPQR